MKGSPEFGMYRRCIRWTGSHRGRDCLAAASACLPWISVCFGLYHRAAASYLCAYNILLWATGNHTALPETAAVAPRRTAGKRERQLRHAHEHDGLRRQLGGDHGQYADQVLPSGRAADGPAGGHHPVLCGQRWAGQRERGARRQRECELPAALALYGDSRYTSGSSPAFTGQRAAGTTGRPRPRPGWPVSLPPA